MHEPWWIFGAEGELSGEGLMRPVRKNGGVHELRFQTQTRAVDPLQTILPDIADGFYGGRQFLFPSMDASQPLLCSVPRLLRTPLNSMTERGLDQWLAEPRLWIKIPMPSAVPQLHHAVNNILLHTMTASNMYTRNQTVRFAQDGLSFPVIREGGTPEFLVVPLAVTSEGNEAVPGGHTGHRQRSRRLV